MPTDVATHLDRKMLARAARLALRGHGGAEPNPLVGCVIGSSDGSIAGEGYHRRCGEAHAERNALRRAGAAARGGTAWITLEPCAHHGRTPPCTDALREAGVARVVYGVADPGATSGGGSEHLRALGISVVHCPTPETERLARPFLTRVREARPWVVAKWAQTIDGRIADRAGRSRWISGEASRRLVHRVRGRVDAIVTGMGTVAADDPELTVRGVRRPRRVPLRVVVDPRLVIGDERRLLATIDRAPLAIATSPDRLAGARAETLRRRGASVLPLGPDEAPLRPLLRALHTEHDVSTVLVEAGGGLVGMLATEDLLDDALVFTAPLILGDAAGVAPLRLPRPNPIDRALRVRRLGSWTRGEDRVEWLRFEREIT